MARDVLALIEHLRLDAVDVIGFSMGCGTTARLLMLHPSQVKSAILAGVGDYVIHDTEMDFPKSWPIPDSVPRPITGRVWAEEGRSRSRTPCFGQPNRGSRWRRRSEGPCGGDPRCRRPHVARRAAPHH